MTEYHPGYPAPEVPALELPQVPSGPGPGSSLTEAERTANEGKPTMPTDRDRDALAETILAQLATAWPQLGEQTRTRLLAALNEVVREAAEPGDHGAAEPGDHGLVVGSLAKVDDGTCHAVSAAAPQDGDSADEHLQERVRDTLTRAALEEAVSAKLRDKDADGPSAETSNPQAGDWDPDHIRIIADDLEDGQTPKDAAEIRALLAAALAARPQSASEPDRGGHGWDRSIIEQIIAYLAGAVPSANDRRLLASMTDEQVADQVRCLRDELDHTRAELTLTRTALDERNAAIVQLTAQLIELAGRDRALAVEMEISNGLRAELEQARRERGRQ